MDKVNQDLLPFFITAPGESDLLFTVVTIFLILVVLGFGAMYFTIQAIPDRLVEGTSKAQMQLVGILGLVSLFTMNNIYWVAALLLAAIRIPDIVTPFRSMSRSQKKISINTQNMVPETPVSETVVENETIEPEVEEVGEKGEDNA
jgi:multisubunit Na+/H+ antiporter MnhF subunit